MRMTALMIVMLGMMNALARRYVSPTMLMHATREEVVALLRLAIVGTVEAVNVTRLAAWLGLLLPCAPPLV